MASGFKSKTAEAYNRKTEMNHGVHGERGVQPKEVLRFAKSNKTKECLTQEVIVPHAFKILYLLPSVLSVTSVVNSHFPF
jgi:hypothetical protein